MFFEAIPLGLSNGVSRARSVFVMSTCYVLAFWLHLLYNLGLCLELNSLSVPFISLSNLIFGYQIWFILHCVLSLLCFSSPSNTFGAGIAFAKEYLILDPITD